MYYNILIDPIKKKKIQTLLKFHVYTSLKIGRSIEILKYADDTNLMAEMKSSRKIYISAL